MENFRRLMWLANCGLRPIGKPSECFQMTTAGGGEVVEFNKALAIEPKHNENEKG